MHRVVRPRNHTFPENLRAPLKNLSASTGNVSSNFGSRKERFIPFHPTLNSYLITRGKWGFTYELNFETNVKHFHSCIMVYPILRRIFLFYFYLNSIKMKTTLNSGLTIQTVYMFHERIDTVRESVDRWNDKTCRNTKMCWIRLKW